MHHVAVLNVAFCMTFRLLMLVNGARGDHMEEAYSMLQTTQDTRGVAVTAVLPSCCAYCVETSRTKQWGHDFPFLGKPAIRTHWMAGAALHEDG